MSNSGQFHVSNMGQEYDAGSVVVAGSTLYYLVPGGDNAIKVDQCDISGVQAGDASSVNANGKWSSFKIASKVTTSNGAKFQTKFRPAAVLLGTTIYYFWVDTNGGQIYMVSMDSGGNFSSQAFKIYVVPSTPATPLTVSSWLSADVAPNGTSIMLSWFDQTSLHINTMKLDPQDINAGTHQWVGVAYGGPTPKDFGASNFNNTYYKISTAWFTQGSVGNFMIASFYSSTDRQAYFLLYEITPEGDPLTTRDDKVFPITTFALKRGVTLSRDPAGRIVGIYCKNDSDTHVYYRIFNTNQVVQQNGGVSPTLSWGSESLLNGAKHDSEKPPVLAFVQGNASANQSTNLPTTAGSNSFFNCTSIPQYSFALYADNNGNSNSAYDIQCQVALYGTSQIVPGYSTYRPAVPNSRIVSMLMDSFPYPNQNIGSSTPNRSLIEYTYGTSSATNLSANMSFSLLFGVKSSLTTTKGIGPAESSEFKTGPQGSFGASMQTTEFHGYSVATTPIAAPAGSATPLKIESHGEYFGTTPTGLVEDISIFKDPAGQVANGNDAPLFSALRPQRIGTTSDVSGQFGAYCYTPGDIYSYQQSNINEKMAALYNALTPQQKQYFTPDYANDYIEKVILPNAQTINGNQNYLQATIDGSGHSVTSFEQIKKLMATLGWTIQGSEYLGASAGEELSVFGFGIGVSASVMVGFEYNFAISGGVETTDTWGISYNMSTPTAVAGSVSYTVKMYICKPSNMWARELQFFAPDKAAASDIDFNNSAPSKIMFVVSNIQPTLGPSR